MSNERRLQFLEQFSMSTDWNGHLKPHLESIAMSAIRSGKPERAQAVLEVIDNLDSFRPAPHQGIPLEEVWEIDLEKVKPI